MGADLGPHHEAYQLGLAACARLGKDGFELVTNGLTGNFMVRSNFFDTAALDDFLRNARFGRAQVEEAEQDVSRRRHGAAHRGHDEYVGGPGKDIARLPTHWK